LFMQSTGIEFFSAHVTLIFLTSQAHLGSPAIARFAEVSILIRIGCLKNSLDFPVGMS
jgi:hypothetical protein